MHCRGGFFDEQSRITTEGTKLLVPRNGTNVEETVNIENKLNLVYNIFM